MLSIQVMDRGHRPPRVFEVPELLSLICSFSRISDCVHLAQTSRAVFRIAAAFVWQHVDGAQHLLNLLSGTLMINATKTSGTKKYALGVSSDIVDFTRFELYAPYVRRLSVYEYSQYYQVSGWGALILRANTQQKPLLPNLLSIMVQTTCNSHRPDQIMWIKAFVSPSVLSIQILPTASMTATPPQISPLAASAILDIISQSCPRLLKLSLFVSDKAVTDKYDGENNMLCFFWKRPYHEYLRTLPTLSELTCSIKMLEPESLRVISALPFLRRLVVYSQDRVVLRPPALPSNSFRSLLELCVKGVDPYEVATILRISSLMNGLTALDLELDLDYLDEDENREEWLTGNLLVSLSNAPKLVAFNLNVDPALTLDDPYNIGDQDVMDAFSKLPLISLTLTGVHISDWASTGSLATVWPLVTSLRMVNQFASPLILSCFARLQHLRHLTLNIFLEDFIPCPRIPNISSLHTLEISSGGFTVCEPEHLEYTGRFLMSLFPALRRVVWIGYPNETPEQASQRRFIGFLNQHMALRREMDMLRALVK